MQLYYLNMSPPCRAVLITAKHLGIEPEIIETDVFKGATRSEEFIKLNPAHNIPTLKDDDLVLSESRAIMAYLVNKYKPNDSLYPQCPKRRARIDRILYFDATTFYKSFIDYFVTKMFYKEPVTPRMLDSMVNSLTELFKLKGDKRFMAGDKATIADISVAVNYHFISTTKDVPFPDSLKAEVTKWYNDVVEAIPSVKTLNDSVDYSIFAKKDE